MTPMMQQYLQIKEQNSDCILFYRLGDFYEMFFEDAKLASKELEIVLTGRECGEENKAPMCGVPFHSCDAYIARLVKKGYKIAICEQTSDPKAGPGLVQREVVRIVTPGTITDEKMLDGSDNNYLAAIYSHISGIGLCFSDISTGEVFVTALSGDGALPGAANELDRYMPREVLLNGAAYQEADIKDALERCGANAEELSDIDLLTASALISEQFKKTPSLLGISEPNVLSLSLGLLLQYIDKTQKSGQTTLTTVTPYTSARFMQIDKTARRNLELTKSMQGDKKGSLLSVLDQTKTAMGARLLKRSVEQPLFDIRQISARQGAVAWFYEHSVERMTQREVLSEIYDIERTVSKAVYGSANARDLLALSAALARINPILSVISEADDPLLLRIQKTLDPMDDLTALFSAAIHKDAPATIREGGMIADGYDEQVDHLRRLSRSGQSIIADIEAREKQETGIKQLKVSYNRVFGYYIEISKAVQAEIPAHYVRKQTLSNCERYITPELKEAENEVLSAKERLTALEFEIFCTLRARVVAEQALIQRNAQAIAQLDMLASLAEVAVKYQYVRPELVDGGIFEIKDGRHPVVESLLRDVPFVPNDTYLDEGDNRVLLLTGPNMAGKSTYMRQVALIAILAQMGSFVPAASAKIGLIDRVFTRIGAADDLSSGRSTFMVEMNEVADIVHYATKDSLILLDEIGRGTSTFDGMSIARAVLEYVADKKILGAKTLFATHYHELTDMEASLDGIKNYNIAVKKRGDSIVFLRRIIRGAADDSYGIEVAKLAGLPNSVIARAREVLLELESKTVPEGVSYKADLSVPQDASSVLLEKLARLDPETLTPIEAMGVLYQLVKEARAE